MPNTSKGFPYPSNSDDVDVAGDIQALATAVDAYVGNLEGTAIKSTGQPSSYVLTSNGSNGASWLAGAGDAGAFSTVTATANFSAANDFFVYYPYTLGTAVTVVAGIGGGGTVFAVAGSANATSTSRVWNTFAIPAHTANATAAVLASATVSTYTSGTYTGYVMCVQDGNLANSTSIYWTEQVAAPSTGNRSYALRRYSMNLTASVWATVIRAAGNSGAMEMNYDGMRAKYNQSIGAWFGAFTEDNQPGTAFIWLVNDTSGSVYTATFGTYASGSPVFKPVQTVYVPPIAAGNGTIYGMTVESGGQQTRRVVAFTASSASITNAGTLISNTSGYNFAGTTISTNQEPDSLYWDGDLGFVVATFGANIYAIDRTFATATFMGSVAGANPAYHAGRLGAYIYGGNLTLAPSNSTATYGKQQPLLPTRTNGFSFPAYPNGTPTAVFDIGLYRYAAFFTSSTANMTSRSINYYRQATVTFPTEAYGRIIWDADVPYTAVTKAGVSDARVRMVDAGTSGTSLWFVPTGGTVGLIATNATATGTITQNVYQLRMK